MQLSDAPFITSLPAHDIERAVRWYEEKLGLTPSMDLREAGQMYSTGGSMWIIYQTPSGGVPDFQTNTVTITVAKALPAG